MCERCVGWRVAGCAARGVAHERGGARRGRRRSAAPPRHAAPSQEQARQPDRRGSRARSYSAGAYSLFMLSY